MTIVWEEKHETWQPKLADVHRDAWILSMVNRLRTALAHLSKTIIRGRTRPALPRWLEMILSDPDLLSGDSAPPAECALQPGAEEEEGEQQEEEEGEEEEVTEKDEVEEEPQPAKKK
eukprot:5066300-Heterocapsa_arctica.AAC.1